MTAVDLDGPENNLIHYSIVSGDPWQQFSIDPQTGHIKVHSILDREEVSSFRKQVKEGGSNEGRLTCFISLLLTSTDLFLLASAAIFLVGSLYTTWLTVHTAACMIAMSQTALANPLGVCLSDHTLLLDCAGC